MTRLDHADLHRLFDEINLKPHASPYDVLNNRDYQTLGERRETIAKEGLSLDDPLCYQRVYLSDDEIRRFFQTAERSSRPEINFCLKRSSFERWVLR